MGDFNCVCSEDDRSTGNRRYDSSTGVLSDLISEYGLVDIGSTKGSTVHFAHFNPFSSARLDRTYISTVKCSIVRDYVVRPIFFTDHCMVSVRVGPRGWRAPPIPWELWKLNNSILSDELFQHSVAACLKETFALSRLTVFQKWDLFKQEVKNLAVEASARASFLQRHHMRELSRLLTQLREAERAEPGSLFQKYVMLKLRCSSI